MWFSLAAFCNIVLTHKILFTLLKTSIQVQRDQTCEGLLNILNMNQTGLHSHTTDIWD